MEYEIYPLSENSVTIDFGNVISAEKNRLVMSLYDLLSAESFQGFIEAVPAYSSLTIFYDLASVKRSSPAFPSAYSAVMDFLERTLGKLKAKHTKQSNPIEMPVCYEEEFAPDIKSIAKSAKVSVTDVIRIHTSGIYRVFMLGFLPGFAYMGEVDKKIAVPRLKTPRTKVDAGSVGIAGRQTGIYPSDSPGGWQIIGRTPLRMFRPEEEKITLLSPGDMVRFYEIDKKEFLKIAE